MRCREQTKVHINREISGRIQSFIALSCSVYPFQAVLLWPYPSFHNLAVLSIMPSRLSCSGLLVLSCLSWLSSPGSSVLAVLFRSSWFLHTQKLLLVLLIAVSYFHKHQGIFEGELAEVSGVLGSLFKNVLNVSGTQFLSP